jgi:serine/threonine protein kinase
MAPEQAIGRSREVDERTDLWAIGSVAFALLVGDVVHPAESAQETLVRAATQPSRPLAPLVPGLPASVAGVIDRALAFERRDRWPSATAMRDALVAASKEAYGQVPGRETLKTDLSTPSSPCLGLHRAETLDLPHADTELPPEPIVGPEAPPASIPRSQALVTTGAALLASSPAIEVLASPPPSRRWRMGRTGVMGGGAMLIGALLLVRAGTAPVASAAPNVETAPRAVVGSLLMLRHPDMPTDSPLSSLSPVSSLSPTAAEEEALADVDGREDTLLATKGEASPSQLVHAKATVVAPSASAPARTAPVPAPPSCTPPFVIQPRTGRKIWKLECL